MSGKIGDILMVRRIGNLAGADAKTVAETALKRFCSFTPKDLEDEKVVERLNGVVHPPLWDQITDDPDIVVPIVPGRTAGQWESTGGKTKVEIRISGEQHPADTDDSWSRKMICVRNWSGFSKPFKDLYLVVVTKKRRFLEVKPPGTRGELYLQLNRK